MTDKPEHGDMAFTPGPKRKEFPHKDDTRHVEDKDREEYKQLNQDHYGDD